MTDFVHLHTHSAYSLLDGYSPVKDIAKKAASMGQKAFAITDHGNMYAIWNQAKYAKEYGIQPIYGTELYFAEDVNVKTKGQKRFHILLLAKNNTGLANLFRLVSLAQVEGFYYNPRIDFKWLEEYSEGLVVTSGCLASYGNQQLMLSETDGDEAWNNALSYFGRLYEMFGENFFFEVQEHYLTELTETNKKLFRLWDKYFPSVKGIITNDSHYTEEHEADIHDLLLCIQTGSDVTIPRAERFGFGSNEFYIKTPSQLQETYKKQGYETDKVTEWMQNTVLVAEMCSDATLTDFYGYQIPVFDETKDSKKLLAKMTNVGIVQNGWANDQVYTERAKYELEIINKLGFADYFLIINDLCDFMLSNDIAWNLRGSGAGSLVAFLIGITSIDPIKHGLIFERFLNPSRVSMPDMDIDIDSEKRHIVAEYLLNKYGQDKIAHILTFGMLKALSAFKDVCRGMGVDYNQAEKWAKKISDKATSIKDALDITSEGHSPLFAEEYDKDEQLKKIVENVVAIENRPRQDGVHASGIVVTPEPLTNYVPLNRVKSKTALVPHSVAIDMKLVDDLGLLKIDLLGLIALHRLTEVCKLIKERHGIAYNERNIPYEADSVLLDPKKPVSRLYKLLGSNSVAGVFQVESEGMKAVLKQMRPSKLEHITAAISLFRPGPLQYIDEYCKRKDNKTSVVYYHPIVEDVLKETFGIIIYQEQVMKIAQLFAGYTLAEADILRKEVSKKLEEKFEAQGKKFLEGALANGHSAELAKKIWADIATFARYGFNKAHATDYAKLCAQTAYLKAWYTLEWYTVLLNTTSQDKVSTYLSEIRADGIEVVFPSIKLSSDNFRIVDEKTISYGLSMIKGVTTNRLKKLKLKSYESFWEMFANSKVFDLDKRTLSSLVNAGVFDVYAQELGMDSYEMREWLLADLDKLCKYAALQKPLFSYQDIVGIKKVPYDKKVVLEREKDVYGFYLTGNPYADEFYIASLLADKSNNIDRVVAGIAQRVKIITDKRGNEMAFADIVDEDNQLSNIVIFASVYGQYKQLLKEGSFVYANCTIQRDSLIAFSLVDINAHRHLLSKKLASYNAYDASVYKERFDWINV